MGRGAPQGRRSGGATRGYDRTARLNELLVRILAAAVARIAADRLGFLPVAGVAPALAEHRSRLQRAIGSQARVRRVPPLTCVVDDTVRSADRIEEILRGLAPFDEEE